MAIINIKSRDGDGDKDRKIYIENSSATIIGKIKGGSITINMDTIPGQHPKQKELIFTPALLAQKQPRADSYADELTKLYFDLLDRSKRRVGLKNAKSLSKVNIADYLGENARLDRFCAGDKSREVADVITIGERELVLRYRRDPDGEIRLITAFVKTISPDGTTECYAYFDEALETSGAKTRNTTFGKAKSIELVYQNNKDVAAREETLCVANPLILAAIILDLQGERDKFHNEKEQFKLLVNVKPEEREAKYAELFETIVKTGDPLSLEHSPFEKLPASALTLDYYVVRIDGNTEADKAFDKELDEIFGERFTASFEIEHKNDALSLNFTGGRDETGSTVLYVTSSAHNDKIAEARNFDQDKLRLEYYTVHDSGPQLDDVYIDIAAGDKITEVLSNKNATNYHGASNPAMSENAIDKSKLVFRFNKDAFVRFCMYADSFAERIALAEIEDEIF